MMAGLEQKVRQAIAAYYGWQTEAVQRDSRLYEDLGMNSLEFYEIVADLEPVLGVRVTMEGMATVQTVGDLTAHFADRLGAWEDNT
ncbi:MAG: acyl carrier protein [Bifidobacteriaceae bacterium]|jgi:acyl carrier protein|nr:acyl carrier protein [Bifidobacteriaceae bacterium]